MLLNSALTLAIQTNVSFFLEEVRDTDVSQETIVRISIACVVFDLIKEPVTVREGSDRVEHRALG